MDTCMCEAGQWFAALVGGGKHKGPSSASGSARGGGRRLAPRLLRAAACTCTQPPSRCIPTQHQGACLVGVRRLLQRLEVPPARWRPAAQMIGVPVEGNNWRRLRNCPRGLGARQGAARLAGAGQGPPCQRDAAATQRSRVHRANGCDRGPIAMWETLERLPRDQPLTYRPHGGGWPSPPHPLRCPLGSTQSSKVLD